SDTFAGDIIRIKVESAAKEYRIHKALLRRHSGYFRGALRYTNFAEGRLGIVTLRDIEIYTFAA
ncbi:hypothetical protein T440DRAFT_355973, partial [Plenodomus tracheiphilus IPT5]